MKGGAPITEFDGLLTIVRKGENLTAGQMARAMTLLLESDLDDRAIGVFLMALKEKGETIEEIAAAAKALRARVRPITAPDGAIDTCGTGGDGANTFNISTAAALIIAGCGVPVAKHGNRSASSRCGSSDVLAQLGVNLNASAAVIERCISQANVGFMFAALHHPAVAKVAAARRKIGARTIFNLLGPLSNPAGTKYQLMGVNDGTFTDKLASALGALGARSAWVVSGGDGLDELTTTTHSLVTQLRDGAIRSFVIAPEDAGIARATRESLIGGEPEDNAAALRRLLDGESGAYRDISVLNAAAALVVCGKSSSLREAAAMAQKSIDNGSARQALRDLVRISNERPS